VFEAHDGWRYQGLATDTPTGQLGFLEARHRAHARVEDRIRNAKQTGLGRFPSRGFAINAAWLQLALTAADLIAWTQTILLHGDLATAEPKLLRYRLLHTAARIVHRGRRTFIKIAAGWPWAEQLLAAFTRLASIRQPMLTGRPALPDHRQQGPLENRTPGRRTRLSTPQKSTTAPKPHPAMIISGLTKDGGWSAQF
jgi:hypothetical protein